MPGKSHGKGKAAAGSGAKKPSNANLGKISQRQAAKPTQQPNRTGQTKRGK